MDSVDNPCRFTRFAHFSQSSPGLKSAVHAAFREAFLHACACKSKGMHANVLRVCHCMHECVCEWADWRERWQMEEADRLCEKYVPIHTFSRWTAWLFWVLHWFAIQLRAAANIQKRLTAARMTEMSFCMIPASFGARPPLQIPKSICWHSWFEREWTHPRSLPSRAHGWLANHCYLHLFFFFFLLKGSRSCGTELVQSPQSSGPAYPVLYLQALFLGHTVDSIHKQFILLHFESQPKRKRSLQAWAPTQSKLHFWLWTHYWFHFEPARSVKHSLWSRHRKTLFGFSPRPQFVPGISLSTGFLPLVQFLREDRERY